MMAWLLAFLAGGCSWPGVGSPPVSEEPPPIDIGVARSMLDDPDPQKQVVGATRLLDCADPGAFSGLVKILEEGKREELIGSIVKAMTLKRDLRGLPHLLNLACAPGENPRLQAQTALAEIRSDDGIPLLVSFARNAVDGEKQRVAIRILGGWHHLGAVEPLIALLESPLPEIRSEAASALVNITKMTLGEDAAQWKTWWERNRKKTREIILEEIIVRLEQEREIFRQDMADEMIRIVDVKDRGKLQFALRSGLWPVRAKAALALGELGERADVPVLVPLLADGRSEVRQAAVQALGRLGSEDSASALLALLAKCVSPQDREMIKQIVESLGRVGLPPVIPALAGVLRDRSAEEGLRLAAAGAISSCPGPEAGRELLDFLAARRQENKPALVVAVLRGLKRLKYRAAVPVLAGDLLEDPDPEVRWYAADGLREIGCGEALPALVASLRKETSPRVREALISAWEGLESGNLGPELRQELAEELLKLLHGDPDTLVRKAAARRLGHLGRESDLEALAKSLAGNEPAVAEEAMKSALALSAGRREPLERLAGWLAEMKQPGSFQVLYYRYWLESIKERPEDFERDQDISRQLAWLLVKEGRWEEAVEMLERLLKQENPRREENRLKLLLAQSLVESRVRSAEAERYLSELAGAGLEENPEWYWTRCYYRARLLGDRKEYREAEKMISEYPVPVARDLDAKVSRLRQELQRQLNPSPPVSPEPPPSPENTSR